MGNESTPAEASDAPKREHWVIISRPRSGTTWLAETILRVYPDARMLFEPFRKRQAEDDVHLDSKVEPRSDYWMWRPSAFAADGGDLTPGLEAARTDVWRYVQLHPEAPSLVWKGVRTATFGAWLVNELLRVTDDVVRPIFLSRSALGVIASQIERQGLNGGPLCGSGGMLPPRDWYAEVCRSMSGLEAADLVELHRLARKSYVAWAAAIWCLETRAQLHDFGRLCRRDRAAGRLQVPIWLEYEGLVRGSAWTALSIRTCPSTRAYHQFADTYRDAAGVPSQTMRPEARKRLAHGATPVDRWRKVLSGRASVAIGEVCNAAGLGLTIELEGT